MTKTQILQSIVDNPETSSIFEHSIVHACKEVLNRPTDLEQVRTAVDSLKYNLDHISFCNDIIARYGRKLRMAKENNRVSAPTVYSQEYFDNYQNAIDDFNKQIESYKLNIDKIISEL